MKFIRWHEFHCLAAPRPFIEMTRRAQSNTAAIAFCATIVRHGGGKFQYGYFKIFEMRIIVSTTNIFARCPHVRTPTHQEIKTCDRQGKPKKLTKSPCMEILSKAYTERMGNAECSV